jgi:methylmalonyl-CoA/ethylmalonyl-CoA epimerase
MDLWQNYLQIKKMEHIGIAVKNINEASLLYEKLLGIAPYKEEQVTSEGVKTVFFNSGNTKIEL